MSSDPVQSNSPVKAARTLPRLALSHFLALILVASFSIISYLILSTVTESSTDTGMIITVSQQRVSGQRIAYLAAQLARVEDEAEIRRLQAQMARALDQFQHLHRLVYPAQASASPLSPETRALYDQAPYRLASYISQYSGLTQALLSRSEIDLADAEADIDGLLAAAPPVDVGLSRVVTQLRDERRDRVKALINLELVLMIATLSALGVVGLVILLPLQRRMRSTVRALGHEIERCVEAEADLSEHVANLQSLVSALTEGILLYDREANLMMYNASAERLLKLPLADYLGKPLYDPNLVVIHPDGRKQESEERPIVRALRTGQPVTNVVLGLVRGQDEPTWLKLNVQPIFKDGVLSGAVTSMTDITESKRISEQLEQGRMLMRTILDNSPDSIFVVDRQSRILLVNPAEARMMGLSSPQEAVGKTVFDIYPRERAQAYFDSEQTVMATGEMVLDKIEHLKDEQGERWFSVAKVPLRNSEGQIVGMLGVSRNITARVLAEQRAKALERERDKVEMLSQLMGDTSHELRTPLSLINTSLYLLRRTDDPARRAERMNAIEEQVRYLTALLDQMQNMSTIDQSGDFALADIDLPGLITQLVDSIRPLAEAQQRTLRLDVAQCDRPLKANERQLHFAIRNLVENALSFTREGGSIHVRAFQQGDHAVIEVEDDGIGIDPDQIPYIFDRFYKGDQARTIGRGGVGLGLSMVKRIISLHGGDVTVQSQPNRGSTFRITLPLSPLNGMGRNGNGAAPARSNASVTSPDQAEETRSFGA